MVWNPLSVLVLLTAFTEPANLWRYRYQRWKGFFKHRKKHSACDFSEYSAQKPCGWVSISRAECEALKCCYRDHVEKRWSDTCFHPTEVLPPQNLNAKGVSQTKIHMKWDSYRSPSYTMPVWFEVEIVDITNAATQLKLPTRKVAGTEENCIKHLQEYLSVGHLHACHHYKLILYSIDEYENRRPSSRKIVQTQCPSKTDQMHEKLRQLQKIKTRQTLASLSSKPCEFQCVDQHYCVLASSVCNGVPDCIDHSDELDEKCRINPLSNQPLVKNHHAQITTSKNTSNDVLTGKMMDDVKNEKSGNYTERLRKIISIGTKSAQLKNLPSSLHKSSEESSDEINSPRSSNSTQLTPYCNIVKEHIQCDTDDLISTILRKDCPGACDQDQDSVGENDLMIDPEKLIEMLRQFPIMNAADLPGPLANYSIVFFNDLGENETNGGTIKTNEPPFLDMEPIINQYEEHNYVFEHSNSTNLIRPDKIDKDENQMIKPSRAPSPNSGRPPIEMNQTPSGMHNLPYKPSSELNQMSKVSPKVQDTVTDKEFDDLLQQMEQQISTDVTDEAFTEQDDQATTNQFPDKQPDQVEKSFNIDHIMHNNIDHDAIQSHAGLYGTYLTTPFNDQHPYEHVSATIEQNTEPSNGMKTQSYKTAIQDEYVTTEPLVYSAQTVLTNQPDNTQNSDYQFDTLINQLESVILPEHDVTSKSAPDFGSLIKETMYLDGAANDSVSGKTAILDHPETVNLPPNTTTNTYQLHPQATIGQNTGPRNDMKMQSDQITIPDEFLMTQFSSINGGHASHPEVVKLHTSSVDIPQTNHSLSKTVSDGEFNQLLLQIGDTISQPDGMKNLPILQNKPNPQNAKPTNQNAKTYQPQRNESPQNYQTNPEDVNISVNTASLIYSTETVSTPQADTTQNTDQSVLVPDHHVTSRPDSNISSLNRGTMYSMGPTSDSVHGKTTISDNSETANSLATPNIYSTSKLDFAVPPTHSTLPAYLNTSQTDKPQLSNHAPSSSQQEATNPDIHAKHNPEINGMPFQTQTSTTKQNVIKHVDPMSITTTKIQQAASTALLSTEIIQPNHYTNAIRQPSSNELSTLNPSISVQRDLLPSSTVHTPIIAVDKMPSLAPITLHNEYTTHFAPAPTPKDDQIANANQLNDKSFFDLIHQMQTEGPYLFGSMDPNVNTDPTNSPDDLTLPDSTLPHSNFDLVRQTEGPNNINIGNIPIQLDSANVVANAPSASKHNSFFADTGYDPYDLREDADDEQLSQLCKYLGICPTVTSDDACKPICYRRGVKYCIFPDNCVTQNTTTSRYFPKNGVSEKRPAC